MLYLAADHAGFELKEKIAHKLAEANIAFEDFGTFSTEAADYPRYAKHVAKEVVKNQGRGILFCGSGQGMAIVANRYKGIRAAVGWSDHVVIEARQDNDANILSVPARYVDAELAWTMIRHFLGTTFSHEERHKRRLSQIDEK